jgi:NADPH-dependent curcumin reductase CurA
VVVRNAWLSLDPYMRQRMNDARSYAERVDIGNVMVGSTVGHVIESADPELPVGTAVTGPLGWQLYALARAPDLRRVDDRYPLTWNLGLLGMPGATAWYGLTQIGHPKPGETLVVSAAAGAVGSVVGQLGKALGCKVVGVAGGKTKCAVVQEAFGFDHCVDYKSPGFLPALRKATPEGVDIYFENVGGAVFENVLDRLNPFARIPLCGLISQYNNSEPDGVEYLYAKLLYSRVRFEGFIASDHAQRWPEAFQALGPLALAGRIQVRETIAEGLEQAPAAFIGMLRGANVGKQLVKLA